MKSLLPLALLLVGCGGGAVAPTPEPTPTPSPAAVAPSPRPTPTPQWQAPEGWMEFQAEGGQWLAIRQRPMPSCGGDVEYCADFDVMPSVSCRNGIYMEVQWIDANTGAVEDWGNAYLPRLMEGQVGRMFTGIDWPPKGFNMTITCHE